MPNYLTKEEIRQWRSSLEKITLEEFATRLGKVVEESKPTNDLVDILRTKGTSTNFDTEMSEDFSKIAERAFKREQQISHTPFSIRRNTNKSEEKSISDIINNTIKSDDVKKEEKRKKTKDVKDFIKQASIDLDNIKFKKALTEREQVIFEYLINNAGKTVYAKDMAALLGLPRDYIYKYIKSLRAKMECDILKNVASGGFILVIE